MAGKGIPCGASYIAANKKCNIGVSLKTGEGVLNIVEKAKRKGVKAPQIKRLADAVREKYGLKQIKGEALKSFHGRINELIAGGEPPKSAAEKAAKEASAKVSKKPAVKQKAKPEPKPNSLDQWGVDQLKDRWDAARKLGFDDRAAQIEKAVLRKLKDDPDAKKEFQLKVKINKLDREIKDAQNKAGASGELINLNIQRNKAEKAYKKLLGDRDPDARPQGVSHYSLDSLRNIDRKIERDTTDQVGGAYDWESSLRGGSKLLGQGAFGTAILDKTKNVVKRGSLGPNEARIIEKVGKLGLGPELISSQLDGDGQLSGTKIGRMAMTRVPGSPIGRRQGPEIERAYWTARAALHRAGVAHNDMHIENVLVDRKGQGRFVDFGLAQDNPKAALAEAFGVFGRSNVGDWQVRRWRNLGGRDLDNASKTTSEAVKREFASRFPTAAKVLANKERAILKMKQFGLNDRDIENIADHGIRRKDESFEKGSMGKLTYQQAQDVIDTLYLGI